MTVACHVIPASGRLVDVDIPKLSESPWPGIDIFCASMGLGQQIVKELDLKLALGMAEGDKLSLHMMRNHGEVGQQFKISVGPKVILSWRLDVYCPIGHSTG